ncbi:rhoGEF domain-containing protein [Ditylenchus destructor]|uniref:RhoGEF domain-containing protein n=1 Tax=Ditylenchus destructor TaxID=166010 RepID=A0AAD4N534_9BILA|nr:rhoGEF domain-containing protein [Ditylenchus destructor]
MHNSSSYYLLEGSGYDSRLQESRYSNLCDEQNEIPEEDVSYRICLVGDAKNNKELVKALTNHYGFYVLHSEKGIEYRNEPDVLFVMADFESPDFKYLNSIPKPIIGPAIVTYSMRYQQPLPRVRSNRPIYCCSMKGMRFSLSNYTSSETRRAVDLIHFMGGSARKTLNKEDMLICKQVSGEKYRNAVNMGLMILTLEWVEQCWRQRDNVNFRASDRHFMEVYKIKCFQNLRIYFAGFTDNPDLEEMMQLTTKNGGILVSRYEEATHAVCAEDFSHRPGAVNKFLEHPPSLNIKHVTREWFWKSVHMGQCASEDLYTSFTPCINNRPLQGKENFHNSSGVKKSNHYGSPSADEVLRPSKKSRSKSSIDNWERSNTSSTLPEHMYSSDNLDFGNSPKKLDKRYQVCVEMLETEQNYIRVLNILMDVFQKPLEEKILEGDELLNKKEIAMIFSKIPAIIQAHNNICNQLERMINDWNRETCLVGQVWAYGANDLEKVYPPYINSYDESLQTLELCDVTRPKFHTFLKMAESRTECQKNSLKDMLIRPVQRIPSVLLLLQELLKRTDKSNDDYRWVKGAVDQMKKVLQKTNESRRQTEDHKIFLEICNDIEGFPAEWISSEREYTQSIDVVVLDAGGFLHKYKGMTLGLFLFNDIIVITKRRSNTSNVNASSMAPFGNGCTLSRGSTLTRQLSFATLRRKERRPYKLINVQFFSAFRSLEVIKDYGVFIVKLRDEKADELCVFQLTREYTMEIGIDFFENLIKRTMQQIDISRELMLEELTYDQLDAQYATRPEECEAIKKAL